MRLLKLVDKHTGWVTEGCHRPHGRRFAKRWEHRHNRHYYRLQLKKESQDE